jgi:cysteine desulfurase
MVSLEQVSDPRQFLPGGETGIFTHIGETDMERERRIYLDHNATTPVCPEAAAAMATALEGSPGNPSSVHHEGRAARSLIERSRSQLAALLDADPAELLFCSSGTEAVALGLIGVARARVAAGAPPRVLVGASEHPAVAGAAAALGRAGFAVKAIPVLASGQIDLDAARAALAGGAAAVAVSWANHEVGTVQPVAELAALADDAGASMICDAVQAAGKVALDPAGLGLAALALSAHKIYGPPGVGALWLRRDLVIEPIVGGGHQERDRRPGTENLPGIAGAGAAAEVAAGRLEADAARAAALTARFEAGLAAIEGATVVGAAAPRIGNTSCVHLAGAPGDAVVAALDLAGFAVSAGAACTSGRLEPSPVLLAMGFDAAAASQAIRVSVGRANVEDDIEALLEVLPGVVARVRRFA